ncbi:hypothetical protein GCM10009534_54990 [Kribbella sandramycini]
MPGVAGSKHPITEGDRESFGYRSPDPARMCPTPRSRGADRALGDPIA